MIAMNYDTDTTQNNIMITMITYKKRLLHGYPLVKRLHFANWTTGPLDHRWPSLSSLNQRTFYVGLSENSVPHCTQWFCWSLSLLNGYFIGNINPTFSDIPMCSLPAGSSCMPSVFSSAVRRQVLGWCPSLTSGRFLPWGWVYQWMAYVYNYI